MSFKKKNHKNARGRCCRFCSEKDLTIDYKDAKVLKPYLTERGKIIPRRITGNCRYHQGQVTIAIKRARVLAIIPFTATQLPLL